MLKSTIAAASAALAFGCTQPDYVPAESAKATLGGRTAAQYQLPSSDDPKANVRVASYGFTKLKRAGSEQDVRAVHVRFSLENNDEEPVSFDVRSQRIQFPDGLKAAPVSARASAAGVPVIEVPPHSSRTVDLLFPVPPELAKASRMPHFDVAWNVNLNGEVADEITPFERVAIDPAVARERAAFYGPWGWSDPIWGPIEPGWPNWSW